MAQFLIIERDLYCNGPKYQVFYSYHSPTKRFLFAIGRYVDFSGHWAPYNGTNGVSGPSTDWVPLNKDLVVVLSGILEIVLGASLILFAKYLVLIGWAAALFFIAVFPGNISQFVNGRDAFGLNSDAARAIRLLFQPVLVVWALWCTGAWRAWRKSK